MQIEQYRTKAEKAKDASLIMFGFVLAFQGMFRTEAGKPTTIAVRPTIVVSSIALVLFLAAFFFFDSCWHRAFSGSTGVERAMNNGLAAFRCGLLLLLALPGFLVFSEFQWWDAGAFAGGLIVTYLWYYSCS